MVADSFDVVLILSNGQDAVDVTRLAAHVYKSKQLQYAPKSLSLSRNELAPSRLIQKSVPAACVWVVHVL